MFEEFHNCI